MEREHSPDPELARLSLHPAEGRNGIIQREVPVPAEELSAEGALEIAIEAYVYAYPLVLMGASRTASTDTATADSMAGIGADESVLPRAHISRRPIHGRPAT